MVVSREFGHSLSTPTNAEAVRKIPNTHNFEVVGVTRVSHGLTVGGTS